MNAVSRANRVIGLLAGVAVLVGVCVPLRAGPGTIEDLLRDGDVIAEQLPTRLGGLASDTAFRDYVGRPIWAQTADNILVSESSVVATVSWYGFYGGYMQNHYPPAGDETMRIRFYAARPTDGLPGAVLYEESFLNPLRSATGFWVGAEVDAPEYLFAVDLPSPVTLAAGTPYWLEIIQVGDLESHFRWEDGYGLLSQHATLWTSVPQWQYNGGSLSFRLSAIPEPAALAFVSIAAIFLLIVRQRKERMHEETMMRRQPS